jgi:hypothetical protein
MKTVRPWPISRVAAAGNDSFKLLIASRLRLGFRRTTLVRRTIWPHGLKDHKRAILKLATCVENLFANKDSGEMQSQRIGFPPVTAMVAPDT